MIMVKPDRFVLSVAGWLACLMFATLADAQTPQPPLLEDLPPEPPTEIRVRGVVGLEALPPHERLQPTPTEDVQLEAPPRENPSPFPAAESPMPRIEYPTVVPEPTVERLPPVLADPPQTQVEALRLHDAATTYRSRLAGTKALDVRPPLAPPPAQGIRLVAEEQAPLQPALFKRVEPGRTTSDDLNQMWDAPREVKTVQGTERRVFEMPPFRAVEVDLVDGIVRGVVVTLDESVPATSLAAESKLETLSPVIVTSPDGELLGQAYPERGVLFTYDPSAGNPARPLVAQIVFEEIQPEPFVLRAEANLAIDYRKSAQDVEIALKMDPNYNRAHWIKAQVQAAGGEFSRAIETMQRVIKASPDDPHYRLTHADLLEHSGRSPEAIQELLKVVELAETEPLLQAQVLLRLGNHAASGPKRDLKEALDLHQEALKLALPLLTAEAQPATQFTAQDILVDCYLAVANDIAWGDYDNKIKAVPQWLDRAKTLTESEALPPEFAEQYQFRLGVRGLSAYVGMNEPLPDDFYAELTFRNGMQLLEDTPDAGRKAQLAWSLGVALNDACQLYLLADDSAKALRCGEEAIAQLQAGYEQQSKTDPTASYVLGRAMFRIGTVHLISVKDIKQALVWYDKALGYLDRPLPDDPRMDFGQLGETMVSMGVAYWQGEQKQKAVELTDKGRQLMERAVAAGQLDRQMLDVPYRNLASMHRALGQIAEAERFERMSSRETDSRRR